MTPFIEDGHLPHELGDKVKKILGRIGRSSREPVATSRVATVMACRLSNCVSGVEEASRKQRKMAAIPRLLWKPLHGPTQVTTFIAGEPIKPRRKIMVVGSPDFRKMP